MADTTKGEAGKPKDALTIEEQIYAEAFESYVRAVAQRNVASDQFDNAAIQYNEAVAARKKCADEQGVENSTYRRLNEVLKDAEKERKDSNHHLDAATKRRNDATKRLYDAAKRRKNANQLLINAHQRRKDVIEATPFAIVPECISKPSHATFLETGHKTWNSSPLNHRIAIFALSVMEKTDVESEYLECAQEIFEKLSKANAQEDQAGLFSSRSEAYGEISMTAMLTEVLSRKLVSAKSVLRWYHQIQDPTGGLLDIALYSAREKDSGEGLEIPCAIIEVGMKKAADNKQYQTVAHLINLSRLLDTNSHALLSVELMLNFKTRNHHLTLRCTTLTGQQIVWNSKIWTGKATETSLARVLHVLVENAKRSAKAGQLDWTMLGPNCALDLKERKVYKCFDYRYRGSRSEYERSALYYREYLKANTVVQFDKLQVITYDYRTGCHVAKISSDFISILEMLHSLHKKRVIHGDIRLSNIVFAGSDSSLIDFDLSGVHLKKKYPPGFNCQVFDGFRHEGAIENSYLEYNHDYYAMARLMNLFSTTESPEQWSAVCNAVANGEIGTAIQTLHQFRVPLLCSSDVADKLDTGKATGSPQKQSIRKRCRSKESTSESSRTVDSLET